MMAIDIDALICGGGVTGLWLRSVLKAYGRSVVLIESDALGSGQTIASQGIIHNGAKYAAQAKDVEELIWVLPAMPCAWDLHLSGENLPDLRGTAVTTKQSWYWNPAGPLPGCLDEWWNEFHQSDSGDAPPPPLLQEIRGGIRRNNERTLAPASLLNVLAGTDHRDLLLVPTDHVRWTVTGPGEVTSVTLRQPTCGDELELRPQRVFFTAGVGNAALREAVGLPGETVMQRRPLRMGLVRGELPRFCGHWFDDGGPRLTISTQFDGTGRTVWQLGGRLAEDPGAERPGTEPPGAEPEATFLARARREVSAGLPGLDLSRTEWSSYRAVRAEPITEESRIPSLDEIQKDGNVITMWPTKLTLVPHLMIDIRRALDAGGERPSADTELPDWPRPQIARPPWETVTEWIADVDAARVT